ncbi:MAG: glutathione S-transferase [Gammaproteobacteria bacterium]|nr:glutathione S-transferase [Gammaproteobacteria bacterium]
MSLLNPLRLTGAPGSPYTRKMLALLRYRRLPYEFILGNPPAAAGLPKPKVPLLPTFYLPNAQGRVEAVVDSTPLIRRFEADFPDRKVVSTDPVVAFIDYLIEDYADEWLTKAMFHYRWRYQADIDKAGEILPRWRDIAGADADLARRKAAVQERQISRLYVVGSNATTAGVIEASYVRFLDIFSDLLASQPFIAGSRPGAADFGVFGQLTQLARFDPTPASLTLTRAPRVYAWVDVVDDLSGLAVTAEDFIGRSALRDRLGPLLNEIGRVYVPFLLANGRAVANALPEMTTTIDGKPWQQPTFPYQAKCLTWLRAQWSGLTTYDRDETRAILADSGVMSLFE